MKFNKIILPALLFSLCLLLNCGGKSENEMTVWHQMNAAERAVLDTILEEFMAENPGLLVSQRYYETEELRSNFIISSLGGSGPELIHGPSDQIGPFEVMDIVLPMETLLDEEYINEFDSLALTWRNGHLYQIGDQVGNHLTLCYNKKLLPEPPQTIEELIEFGLEFTKDLNGDGNPDQYALVWNFIEPYFFIPFLSGFGGWVMDENEMPTLNTEAAIRAFNFILDLRNKYKIIPRECDLDMANLLFQQGNAAMTINGPWSWGDYLNAGIDLGLAKIPLINETGLWPAPMISPRGYSLNSNLKGQRLENTLKLLKFLLKEESQLKFTLNIRTIPSNMKLLSGSIFDNDELLYNSYLQLKAGKQMPVSPNMRAIWDSMRPNYQSLINGSKTPEEAAAAMQREAEDAIRKMMK